MSFCELLAVQRFLFANFEIGAIKLCKRDLVLALLSTKVEPRRAAVHSLSLNKRKLSIYLGADVCLGVRGLMQPSMFNLQVPVAERGEVFLMNTFSDAQLLVSPDVAGLLDRLSLGDGTFNAEERGALDALVENGFVVESRERERASLVQYFASLREDTEQLRVTVLTTLQCNFACDYCFQGDHGDYNKFAHKMSLETAAEVVAWVKERLDTIRPEKFVLTLFGGEPLLNLPIAYYLAERCYALCEARGVSQRISVITNGLLLTPDVVDRLTPYGLQGVKITIDGDRDTHNRMRPLRGKQGTF